MSSAPAASAPHAAEGANLSMYGTNDNGLHVDSFACGRTPRICKGWRGKPAPRNSVTTSRRAGRRCWHGLSLRGEAKLITRTLALEDTAYGKGLGQLFATQESRCERQTQEQHGYAQSRYGGLQQREQP